MEMKKAALCLALLGALGPAVASAQVKSNPVTGFVIDWSSFGMWTGGAFVLGLCWGIFYHFVLKKRAAEQKARKEFGDAVASGTGPKDGAKQVWTDGHEREWKAKLFWNHLSWAVGLGLAASLAFLVVRMFV